MSDKEVLAVLKEKAAAGVQTRVILGSVDTVKDNVSMMAKLRGWGIGAIAPSKPYVHAKAAVADGERAYVGSANFTANSMDRNREVGLLLPPGGARVLAEVFAKDWAANAGK